MPLNSKQFLLQTLPFKVLPAAELDRLASRSRDESFGKGETVYSEGDAADSVWVLKKGRCTDF